MYFFDDILLIYSPTLIDHVTHLGIVLNTLREHPLFAKRSKCTFAQSQVEYLGHIISEKGVSVDLNKVESILTWPLPKDVKPSLRGFLGLTGYYRRLVKNYGIICKPLTDLLKRDGFNGQNKPPWLLINLKLQIMTQSCMDITPRIKKLVWQGQKVRK